MKYGYKDFADEILPYIIYACDRYIAEQQAHINFMFDAEFFDEDTRSEQQHELNNFSTIFNDLFREKRRLHALMFKLFDIQMRESYQDPDTLMLEQIFKVTDLALCNARSGTYVIDKSLMHDIICIHNYIESVFDEELTSPNVHQISWKPTSVNGMTATQMMRDLLPYMDSDDVNLTNQYESIKSEFDKIKHELFKKSMNRCLIMKGEYDICSIRFLVNQFDSLWV